MRRTIRRDLGRDRRGRRPEEPPRHFTRLPCVRRARARGPLPVPVSPSPGRTGPAHRRAFRSLDSLLTAPELLDRFRLHRLREAAHDEIHPPRHPDRSGRAAWRLHARRPDENGGRRPFRARESHGLLQREGPRGDAEIVQREYVRGRLVDHRVERRSRGRRKTHPHRLARSGSGDLPPGQGRRLARREEARPDAHPRLRVCREGLLRFRQVRPQAGRAHRARDAGRDPEPVLPESQRLRLRLHGLDRQRRPQRQALAAARRGGAEFPREPEGGRSAHQDAGLRQAVRGRDERDGRRARPEPPDGGHPSGVSVIGAADRLAFPIAVAALLAGCSHTVEPKVEPKVEPTPEPKVEMKMAVDVLSEPEKATVSYKGKVLGETPQSLKVSTFEDVSSITATSADLDVIEKRIRTLSPDQAEVIFRLGKGGISPIAKRLGLTRILIFEYAEKVCFDSGTADLKPDALPVLVRQAEILNQYFPKADVYVCGYTDSTGSDALNDRLSLQRAETVRNFLVSHNVDATRLKTQGFGKQFEVASNATPEGRALNRRTEVILPE